MSEWYDLSVVEIPNLIHIPARTGTIGYNFKWFDTSEQPTGATNKNGPTVAISIVSVDQTIIMILEVKFELEFFEPNPIETIESAQITSATDHYSFRDTLLTKQVWFIGLIFKFLIQGKRK